jgi:predicted MFS family arabinose efflux permease
MDRWGRPAVFSAALLTALALALAGLSLVHSPAAVAPLLLAWGAVGWAFVVPQQHRLLASSRGGPAALALNSSATYLGGSAGSALGGIALAQGLSAATALPLLASGAALTGLLVQFAGRTLAAPTAEAQPGEASNTEAPTGEPRPGEPQPTEP